MIGVNRIVTILSKPHGIQLLKYKMKTKVFGDRLGFEFEIGAFATHRTYAGIQGRFDQKSEIHLNHVLSSFANDQSLSQVPNGILEFNESRRAKRVKMKGPLKIAWVHPMFGKGGGGHYNIFRCQKFLAQDFGIESTNFLYPGPASNGNCTRLKAALTRKAEEYYGDDYAFTPFELDWEKINEFSIHMATTWASCYPILSYADSLLRAYFIQDYEPYFFQKGAKYYLAERTYDFRFFPICAGPWLPNIIGYDGQAKGARIERKQDHCWYSLSADSKSYFVNREPSRHPRKGVCFYLRAGTERRGFELAQMTLSILSEHFPDIPLFSVGMPSDQLRFIQKCTHYGVKSVGELQHIYSSHEVYVVFSFTNYSLLPAEIIACGGTVIDLKLPSNEAALQLFPREKYLLAEPNPHSIAKIIDRECQRQRKNPEHFGTDQHWTEDSWNSEKGWKFEYGKIARALLNEFGRSVEGSNTR